MSEDVHITVLVGVIIAAFLAIIPAHVARSKGGDFGLGTCMGACFLS
jgi:hypothetical protein